MLQNRIYWHLGRAILIFPRTKGEDSGEREGGKGSAAKEKLVPRRMILPFTQRCITGGLTGTEEGFIVFRSLG